MCLYQHNKKKHVHGHVLNVRFSATQWIFHFKTSAKRAVNICFWQRFCNMDITHVAEMSAKAHIFSLGWLLHEATSQTN